MNEEEDVHETASAQAVEIGNRLAENDSDADVWDIADGLLAGAIQYWLYTRQPCGDPACEECAPLRTAEGRHQLLRQLVDDYAQSSEYYHSPNDYNAGRA